MHLWNILKEKREHLYDSLPAETTPEGQTLENSHSYVPRKRNIWTGAALPWTLCAILLVLLAILSRPTLSSAVDADLGTFESGFVTEMRPARAAIKLKKKRFYGGELIDGNGSYVLTRNPDASNYLAPPGPELDALWSKEMLHGGTLGFANYSPDEIMTPEIYMQEKDLVNGRYMGQPSTSHALHCLNAIRKALAREYPPEIDDDIERPYHISHRMHMDHCVENIRQHLVCNFDLTWTPSTWRTEAKVAHADPDQWHVCRDFEAITSWMDTRHGMEV